MPKPITDALRQFQGGVYLDLCSDLFAGIVKAVDETGTAGRLTMVLDIKKVGAAVSVQARVTDKTPTKGVDADLFYPTVEGNLSVENPAQRKLDLRMAEPVPKVIQNVDQATGEIMTG
jgi:hypothetical protein